MYVFVWMREINVSLFFLFILDDFIYWFTLFFEVLLLDSWDRFRIEGYVYIIIFNKVGERMF